MRLFDSCLFLSLDLCFSLSVSLSPSTCRWRAVAKDLGLVQSYFKMGDPWRMNELKFALPAQQSWVMLQAFLRPPMRVILVDWLVEVHAEFRLAPKTLFLGVAYLDRLLLSRPHIERHLFQLYGLTCLWIASKFEDVMTNPIADLVWICDDAYSRAQFELCEVEVLVVRRRGRWMCVRFHLCECVYVSRANAHTSDRHWTGAWLRSPRAASLKSCWPCRRLRDCSPWSCT